MGKDVIPSQFGLYSVIYFGRLVVMLRMDNQGKVLRVEVK